MNNKFEILKEKITQQVKEEMKPCLKHVQPDLNKAMEFCNSFQQITSKKFFDLNDIELGAATNLFKNRLFLDLKAKMNYIEEKYKFMDSLFYKISENFLDNFEVDL